MTEEMLELEVLRRQYPLGQLTLENKDGRLWKRRMEESESYFKTYSAEWEPNRQMLANFRRMIEEFGTYVALAYPIVQNFISDMYFRNPDPFIQDKSGNRDLSKILSDVARSVHAECDTEREMRDGFMDQTWAGFGVIASSFSQKPDDAGDDIHEETGEIDAEGQPIKEKVGIVEPNEQKVLIYRISPWRNRFDPKGRRWDMSDHRYWAFDGWEYLADLIRDPSLTDDDRARLLAYHSRGATAFSCEEPESAGTGYVEMDPEFIRVATRTIWSRRDHKIYKMPFGASFTFTPRPWDEEWLRMDMYPIRYMPRCRVPEDQKNTEGFIGQPDLTRIRPHIENINKAQGLLVNSLGNVIDVYAARKGVLTGMEMSRVEDGGRRFRVMQFDESALAKYPAQQADERTKWDDIIHLLPTGDTKDLQHMAFIDHEFGLIQQIIGQGPADRGGVPDSESATQSLGQQQGMARRMSTNRSDAGKHYNAVTKLIFIIIQARHTLPLRYQTTTAFNEKAWQTFVDPVGTLKNIDLHFDYATGSTEAQTREESFKMRERMATILMPIFQAQQNWRMVLKVAQELIEPLNIIGAEQFFNDEASAIVMQLLTILRGLGKGKIGDMELTADNEKIIAQIPELIASLAKALLTPQQLAEVEAMVAGVDKPTDGQQDVGSLPAAATAGEEAAADGRSAAGAGIIGGIASVGQ